MLRAARLHKFIKSTATLRRKLWREADYERWIKTDSFDPQWAERAQMIARLIPKGYRVIEFGAGLRQLESYLDPSCTYVPSDLASRGRDTLILDLEKRPLPDLPRDIFDVAVFAGVMEYLSDVPGVVSWVCEYVTSCILSYECATRPRHVYGQLRQAWDRAELGWVNAYTEEGLMDLFARVGFFCTGRTLWSAHDGSEPIFTFRRAPGAGIIAEGQDVAHQAPGSDSSRCGQARLPFGAG